MRHHILKDHFLNTLNQSPSPERKLEDKDHYCKTEHSRKYPMNPTSNKFVDQNNMKITAFHTSIVLGTDPIVKEETEEQNNDQLSDCKHENLAKNKLPKEKVFGVRGLKRTAENVCCQQIGENEETTNNRCCGANNTQFTNENVQGKDEPVEKNEGMLIVMKPVKRESLPNKELRVELRGMEKELYSKIENMRKTHKMELNQMILDKQMAVDCLEEKKKCFEGLKEDLIGFQGMLGKVSKALRKKVDSTKEGVFSRITQWGRNKQRTIDEYKRVEIENQKAKEGLINNLRVQELEGTIIKMKEKEVSELLLEEVNQFFREKRKKVLTKDAVGQTNIEEEKADPILQELSEMEGYQYLNQKTEVNHYKSEMMNPKEDESKLNESEFKNEDISYPEIIKKSDSQEISNEVDEESSMQTDNLLSKSNVDGTTHSSIIKKVKVFDKSLNQKRVSESISNQRPDRLFQIESQDLGILQKRYNFRAHKEPVVKVLKQIENKNKENKSRASNLPSDWKRGRRTSMRLLGKRAKMEV